MSRVIITAHTKSIIKAGLVADRRQIREIDFADHAAFENFFDRFGPQYLFAVVCALVQEHQHQFRHVRRSGCGGTGCAGGVEFCWLNDDFLAVNQRMRGGGVGVLQIFRLRSRSRHL